MIPNRLWWHNSNSDEFASCPGALGETASLFPVIYFCCYWRMGFCCSSMFFFLVIKREQFFLETFCLMKVHWKAISNLITNNLCCVFLNGLISVFVFRVETYRVSILWWYFASLTYIHLCCWNVSLRALLFCCLFLRVQARQEHSEFTFPAFWDKLKIGNVKNSVLYKCVHRTNQNQTFIQ